MYGTTRLRASPRRTFLSRAHLSFKAMPGGLSPFFFVAPKPTAKETHASGARDCPQVPTPSTRAQQSRSPCPTHIAWKLPFSFQHRRPTPPAPGTARSFLRPARGWRSSHAPHARRTLHGCLSPFFFVASEPTAKETHASGARGCPQVPTPTGGRRSSHALHARRTSHG